MSVTASAARVLAAIAAVLALAALPSAASAQRLVGADFGFADTVHPGPPATSAPIFQPSSKAWWAGTCDLSDNSTSNGGAGSAPTGSYAHCIDHNAGVGNPNVCGGVGPAPPLPPGVSSQSNAPYTFRGWCSPPAWRLDPLAQAGGRADASATFWLRRGHRNSGLFNNIAPDGDPRNVIVHLPPGVAGNPNATPKCPAGPNLYTVPVACPPESQVGLVSLKLGTLPSYAVPIYNVEPRDGKTAEFILSAGVGNYESNVPIVARARTDGDFGVDALALKIPAGIPLWGQTVTLWAVPWAAEHDRYRAPQNYQGTSVAGVEVGGMPVTGLAGGVNSAGNSQEPQSYDPDWGPIRPFFANPTSDADGGCDSAVGPQTLIEADMWQIPHTRAEASSQAPPVEGCEQLSFAEALVPTAATAAEAASGLDVTLSVDTNDDLPFAAPPSGAAQPEVDDYVADATAHWDSPAGLARAHLKDTVVTMPEGFSLNPSAAAGLEACSDAQLGVTNAATNPPLFNNGDPFDGDASDGAECPSASIAGTVEVKTPLLDETLSGQVVLGEPKSTDPTSGEMFRWFLVVRNRERGLIAKIRGSTVADPATGQLRSTFANGPRLPIETVRLSLKSGERGVLATPQRCSDSGHAWTAQFTPWSAAAGAPPIADGGALPITSNCAFGFAPTFAAGMSSQQAAGSGALTVHLARQDGEQWLRDVSAEMPPGLLAAVGDVPLCSNAQAAAAACPAASRIGSADAGAGAGNPFFLEREGDVYLTEGYKGAPYGLAIVVRVEAGPFRGQWELSPLVVRQALHVDRRTAVATAVSDPLPQIHHGIPLRTREATVTIDRKGFMRNPTSCAAMRVAATIGSAQGTVAEVGDRFQVKGCRQLAFKPKLTMALTGRRQTKSGGHPGVRARVTQRAGQAAIERAEVRLPRSLALDPANARALCEFEDGTKPDLENHCAKGSIVGRATAVSPLLSRPLKGNVYFVKNVRIDPVSGNPRRTLPMIVIALRGEIAINVRAESSARKGLLVSTFDDLPDAPLSRFDLDIDGGSNGILVVTRTRRSKIDVCRGPQVAVSEQDGHNGRHHDRKVRVKVPCAGRKAKGKSKRRG